MDKLLTTSAREALAPPSSDCLDAERLAAWSEGVLPATDAARAEAHLADCSRCQAMLAVFARSQTPSVATAAAGGTVVPFRPRLSARWLLPVAAVAAVLLVWISLPDHDGASLAPAQTTARLEPSPDARLSDRAAPTAAPTAGANRATPAPAPTAPSSAAPAGDERRERPSEVDVAEVALADNAAPAPPARPEPPAPPASAPVPQPSPFPAAPPPLPPPPPPA